VSDTLDLTTRPWHVLVGDCAQTLAVLPDESVDAVVTDTPYGLSTLLDPPNLSREALWQNLTSGAKESPIKTLMRSWIDTGDNPVMRGRGFMGKEWDALVPSPNTWRAVWRVMKPGAYCLAFGGTRTYDLISMSLRFSDFEVDDCVTWLYGQGFPKRVRLDLKIDQHFGKAEDRLVIGPSPGVDSAATPDAARFVGYDRALRPGWEPIIVAVKPLRGTVADNALAHGTGGLHVDACRLPRGDALVRPSMQRDDNTVYGRGLGVGVQVEPGGGYPANVAMDEEVAAILDEQSGHMRDGVAVKHNTEVGKVTGRFAYQFGNTGEDRTFGGGGGASRFFYVAKASSSERDAGLEDLPPLTAGERCDREDGTAGVNGYAGTRGEGGRNPHPTVKPIALMRWLCRLVSPPGAHASSPADRPVILDPFAGSGSTGVACMREGVRFIGCELEERSADVMRRRLQYAYALPPDDAEAPERAVEVLGQKTLF
jgi:site-specific DNA-methyltransferase (adenine-specific)